MLLAYEKRWHCLFQNWDVLLLKTYYGLLLDDQKRVVLLVLLLVPGPLGGHHLVSAVNPLIRGVKKVSRGTHKGRFSRIIHPMPSKTARHPAPGTGD